MCVPRNFLIVLYQVSPLLRIGVREPLFFCLVKMLGLTLFSVCQILKRTSGIMQGHHNIRSFIQLYQCLCLVSPAACPKVAKYSKNFKNIAIFVVSEMCFLNKAVIKRFHEWSLIGFLAETTRKATNRFQSTNIVNNFNMYWSKVTILL